ncbi:MAG: ABC transporter ATP-binding protein [Nitrososphaeraceae archaeon]|nr:ABC transporter ATP-binding protein [Nitrososphaeraceae archaeon]
MSTFYGEFRAINEISLEIKEKEFVAILGPNGHGKSTLLKTICGLLKPKYGSIKLSGEEISKLETHKIVEMGLVYIAEARNLFPEMTVMENLIMGAYPKRARKKQSSNLIYVFELFPRLKERIKQLASTLSGGEARMLAIGRGLMSCASLMVIDEPSLGLAPNLRMDVFNTIKAINNNGVTILMVEQTISEAQHLIDRFYLMEDGKIISEGSDETALSDEHLKQVFLGI